MKNPWRIGFLILGIAVILWTSYALTVPRLAGTWEKSNQFGGMFGGIGALFSGLALAGVVVAVLMQKEELELQREELVATREELSKTAKAQQDSTQLLAEQVQLMLATAKLNANATLIEYYQRNKQADTGGLQGEAVAETHRLLMEFNLKSTEEDRPGGSR